jgi:hypothetical protein
MRITRLSIVNFRSIKALDPELNDTTVLIGPNNAGKTAILDAVRIVLTRRWGQHGTGFTEYDVHLADEHADPKAPPGVSVEIRVEEQQAGEWPEALHQDLDEIVQTDPVTGKTFIILRASCAWNEAAGSFEPSWLFLNAGRAPLVSGSARRMNLERFWQYLPVFYLGALRDVDDEFSSRSQFWGRLLKAMEIPPALEAKIQRVFDLLNKKLLQADPRLARIAETLSCATRVAARDRDGKVDLRLVPLKSALVQIPFSGAFEAGSVEYESELCTRADGMICDKDCGGYRRPANLFSDLNTGSKIVSIEARRTASVVSGRETRPLLYNLVPVFRLSYTGGCATSIRVVGSWVSPSKILRTVPAALPHNSAVSSTAPNCVLIISMSGAWSKAAQIGIS